jgi:hypothetical protein
MHVPNHDFHVVLDAELHQDQLHRALNLLYNVVPIAKLN